MKFNLYYPFQKNKHSLNKRRLVNEIIKAIWRLENNVGNLMSASNQLLQKVGQHFSASLAYPSPLQQPQGNPYRVHREHFENH